ncbi:hypothetical protein CANCADRAFT_128776 [Tortispora caseinolytica NRRL Y-17796]|uniref:Glycolipid transfer protein domain-containing protein n=1 Tax=Tortispora caseinolytica NRRL Y-17796 TaxID=767744 RepID=A0A1E4TAL0_9ASCO|nr:hypothetical protein CANCADRAFT_128776 [Tortispora caseinolytica NRRL Y-17796]
MSTFFDNMKKSFADVTISDGNEIDTAEFLEASESLIKLFDLLDSPAFSVVQKDMKGNVDKIRERLLAKPIDASTLQKLVLDEKANKTTKATQGLLWLTRGLKFTATAIRKNVNNESEELTKSFSDAYSETLSKYHSMMVRPIFKLAMKAVPYRKDFYAKLGSDAAKVKEQLLVWLSALEKVVQIIEEFYESGNYGKGL